MSGKDLLFSKFFMDHPSSAAHESFTEVTASTGSECQ